MNTYKLLEDYFSRVEKYFAEGEFLNAKNLLEEILEIDSTSGRAHNLLGWVCYSKLKDFKEAQFHFEKALELDPANAAIYTNYAFLLNDLGNYDTLIELVTKALQIRGVRKSLLYNELGRAEEMKGRYKEAINNYLFALQNAMNKEEVTIFRSNIIRAKVKNGITG